MSTKRELLAYTLENKKLDVEIKKEQLEQAKLAVATYRKQIFDRAEHAAYKRIDESLRSTISSQHHDIERLRLHLRSAVSERDSQQAQSRTYFNENVDLRKQLDDLRNMKLVKFVEWLRKLVNPVRTKSGFSPSRVLSSEPTSASQLKKFYKETAHLTADEFKKQFIDSEVEKSNSTR